MGASSGWNLVARRPPRARVAPKLPARHLVSAPSARRAADARSTTCARRPEKRAHRARPRLHPPPPRPPRALVRLQSGRRFVRCQTRRRSRYAASRVSGNEIRKKSTRHAREDLERVDLADPGRRVERQPLGLGLAGLQQLDPADHRRERRVLDDVDEQADERRQQAAERLREDHRPVAADPAEPERRGCLVLLARDRLDGAARRLGDLGAAPEDERDRGRGERAELELRRDRGEAEVDDEDRDEDRQAAEDLDVEADEGTRDAGTRSSAASRARCRSRRCR